MDKKLLTVQVVLFVAVAGVFTGLAIPQGMYEQVQSTIVNVLCLSCIKLNPVTSLNFTFGTADGQAHPDFVTENLSSGVVFLAYREDVCAACDVMEPFVQELFEVHFEKEDTVITSSTFNGVNVTLIHISFDHSPQYLVDSYHVYDNAHIGGVPMFTVISYGYNRGFIEPKYATGYGTLNAEIAEEQKQAVETMILDGVRLYHQNHHE